MNHGMNNPSGIYIQYYNALARTLTALGSTVDPKPANISSVSQSDLQNLRNRIRFLADSTLDYAKFNANRTQEDAFDKYRMWVHGKQGFLVVPKSCTSNGEDLYEYEYDAEKDKENDTDYIKYRNALSFTPVPVLFEHFKDMMEVLKKLKYIIKDTMGSMLFRAEPVRSDPETVWLTTLPAGATPPPPEPIYPAMPYYSQWWTSFFSESPTTGVMSFEFGSAICRMYFKAQKRDVQYNWEDLGSDYRVFCLKKEYFEAVGPSGATLKEELDFEWLEDVAPNSREFYHPMPGPDYSIGKTRKYHAFSVPRRHLVWVAHDIPYDELLPLDLDHDENGLIYCGCEDDDFAKVSVQGAHELRYGLGSGSNSGGARMRVYETNIFLPDFDAYCMSRFTTGIASFGSVGMATRGTETVYFRFTTVIRPNGALIPLFWHFSEETPTFAEPVSGASYRFYPLPNGSHELRFNDRAVHVFGYQGAFSQAYLRKDDEILYGSWDGVTITAASGTPSTCTVTTPQGTAQLRYIAPAIYPTATPEVLERVTYRLPGTPGKLYGIATVSGGGDTRSYILRLLLDPTIENPTESDLTVVSEGSISRGSGGGAGSTQTVTTGPADHPYSTTATTWGTTAGGVQNRVVTQTVNGASWSVTEQVRGTSRGALPLVRTTGAESPQPLTTRYGYCDDGREQYRIEPDGSWFYRTYDALGRLAREFRPFGNAALDLETGPIPTQCEVTEYSYAANAPGEVVDTGDSRERLVVRKIQNVEVERSYRVYLAGESRSIRCRTRGAAWDAADNLVTTRYSYTTGQWSGRHWKTVQPDGQVELTTYASSAGQLVETTDSGVPNADGSAVTDGTRQTVTKNSLGFVVGRETRDIASNLVLDTVIYEVDFAGRPTRTTYADGSTETAVYACCGPYKTTGRDGQVTTYTYTPDKKPASRTLAGVATVSIYAPNGAVAETRTVGTDGSYLVTVNEYAENGTLAATKVALAPVAPTAEPPAESGAYAVTLFGEARGANYWTRTTADPAGGTRVEEYDRSGSLRRISGTAVAAEVAYESLLTAGEVCSRAALVRSGNVREVTDTLTDFSGRQYKTVHPDGSFDLTEYDAVARPVKQTAADGTVRLTEYNAKGEVCRTGIDLDRDGELSGADPVTEYEHTVAAAAFGSDTVAVRRQTVKERDGNELIVVSVSESSGDGNRSRQTAFGRTSSFRRSYIDDGEETGMTETAVQPDGSSETRSYSDGLLESATHSVLGATLYRYDAFNRTAEARHVEDGVEHVTLYEYDGRNLPIKVTESGGEASRETVFTYDLNGRKTAETKPGGRTIAYEYYPTGELKKQSGAETYPVLYSYEAGRVKTLTTYRDYPAAPEVTTWHYNAYGQLAAKEYADASRVEYSYNAYGQMTARKWARDRVTGYSYDNAGRLAGVSYDGEDTENISYGYDQRGRLAEVTDASGSRTLTYNADGTVAAESLPQAGGAPLRRGYDALGRPAELRLGEAGYTYICFNNDAVRCIRRITETATEIKLEFAMGAWEERESLTYQPLNTVYRYGETDYDDFGRPSSHPHYQKHRERLAPYLILETQPAGINWDGGYRVAYSYDGMGRLAAASAFGQNAAYARVPGSNRLNTTEFSSGAAPVHTATRSYDDFNRLTGVNGYGYTLNDKDQRTKLTLPDGQHWDYAYDDLGQVTGGVKQTAAAAVLASHTYAYDTIGNRESASVDAVETEYTANNLNQYTAINAETPTYDADGNMLTNGEWSYRWNAENRLIAAENAIMKLEYAYDYMGRRFRKKLYTKDGTSWTLQRTTTFIYDGYKQIAELTDNTVTMYTVWQPPSSGDFDVPLWTKTGNAARIHIPDGNKNIRQLKNKTGQIVATYDYDPFGTPTATGQTTPWQYSSEYRDLETGLVYYNYRYYSPKLGRWINRDPIEEKGGKNLYGMCANNTINATDHLGNFFFLLPSIEYRKCSKPCGEIVTQPIRMNGDWQYFSYVISLLTYSLSRHEFIIADNGEHLDWGGDGVLLPGLRKTIYIPAEISCEDFTQCLKNELETLNKTTVYDLFTNNCLLFTRVAPGKCIRSLLKAYKFRGRITPA